jgi:hypothetical protein
MFSQADSHFASGGGHTSTNKPHLLFVMSSELARNVHVHVAHIELARNICVIIDNTYIRTAAALQIDACNAHGVCALESSS